MNQIDQVLSLFYFYEFNWIFNTYTVSLLYCAQALDFVRMFYSVFILFLTFAILISLLRYIFVERAFPSRIMKSKRDFLVFVGYTKCDFSLGGSYKCMYYIWWRIFLLPPGFVHPLDRPREIFFSFYQLIGILKREIPGRHYWLLTSYLVNLSGVGGFENLKKYSFYGAY